MVTLAALLLADGRFPAGGHVHSAGVEAAVGDQRVHDEASLAAYVRGRLWTAGLVEASFAVATTARLRALPDRDDRLAALHEVNAEADARIMAPPLRAASRRLGRQLVRAAARCWPAPVLADATSEVPDGPHQSVAWGLVGVAAELSLDEVARVVVHHAITTPAQAAVRLLGLDPFAVAALVAATSAEADTVIAVALTHAASPLDELPAANGPLVEIAAVHHAAWDIRMFTT
jgi:urease accessory protein